MRPTPAPVTPPPETEIQPPGVPGLSGLLTLTVAVVVLAALYVGQDVFLPVVLAILLAFVLAPFVDVMRKWHMGRVPAVIIAVLVALGIILSLGAIIGFQVAGLASDIPRYQTTIESKIGSLREGTLGKLPALLKDFGRRFDKAVAEPPPEQQAPASPSAPAPPAAEPSGPLPVEVHEPEPTPVQMARDFLLPLLEPLATTGIVFVVLIFILMQREDLRDRMIRLFGSSDLHRTTAAMDDAARRLSRYFLTQLALNAAFGVVAAIGLWLIGVPSPILWGVFVALMRFVPYIGSFVAAIPPILLAASVDPGWSMALMTLALFLIGEPLMGHVVEPIVYGQSTGLSPFAVVISAIFWTWLWGPVGLLIATPLTLCLVVLGRHVERLEFLDVLLGDRPALTPAENLYQRMLAGDPDEALESAEVLLKERSLTSYYDEVALRGLQLAANDATRGVLTQRQLDQVRDVIRALVQDLGGHEDVEPHPAETEDEPVAPPAERETRQQAAGRGGAAAAGARDSGGLEGGRSDSVRRRSRSPRRGRVRDAVAASQQARARHPRRPSCGRLTPGDLQSRHDRGADGVHQLPRDQRHAGPSALPAAAAEAEGEGADPRRSLARGGCRSEKRDHARNARRELLRLVAEGRGGAVPEGRKRRGEIAGAGQFAECRAGSDCQATAAACMRFLRRPPSAPTAP